MRRPTFPRPRRRGFTIVELLVAAALTMFVMYILAACFATALESFRQVKAVGDMQAKLRSTASTLRRDLMDEHFDRSFNGKGGGPRLSDQNMTDVQWEPPAEGFFRILQLAGSFNEGLDEEGVPSSRSPFATAADTTGSNSRHFLHFTVKRYIRKRDDLFATTVNNEPIAAPNPDDRVAVRTRPLDYLTQGQFLSQWAEVAYFLIPTNTQANGGLPLYYLVRRERPLVGAGQPTTIPAYDTYLGISRGTIGGGAVTQGTLFNSPSDVTAPCRRMNLLTGNANGNQPAVTSINPGPPPTPVYNPQVMAGSFTNGYVQSGSGDDIVLTDVLSFQVKVAYDGYQPAANDEFPFADLPAVLAAPPPAPQTGAIIQSYNAGLAGTGVGIFDTWSSAVGPILNPTPNNVQVYDYSGWSFQPTTANLGKNDGTNIPLRARVRALQIRLRVWDAKTQQARQVTLIQDM
jgi:hypothetical protein